MSVDTIRPLAERKTTTTTRQYLMRASIALALAVLYLTPLVMFRTEGDIKAKFTTTDQHLAMTLRIGVVDFVRDTVSFHVLPVGGRDMGADGRLDKDVILTIDPGTGPVTHTFKAHAPLTPWTIAAAVEDGDILDYPLDSHQIDLVFSAKDGQGEVPVIANIEHIPHGYRIERSAAINEAGESTLTLTVSRSGTIIFVVLMSTISLLLVTGAAMTVAWQVARRGRKIEFSMMVWIAALLFVIPTVRNGLPGAIPPGALIDYLIFFWLQIGAAVAMASLVYTWVRRMG